MRFLNNGLGAATLRAASSPIETLVFCVALTFIAYLYLLHDIQTSHRSFTEPLVRLEPSRLLLQQEWSGNSTGFSAKFGDGTEQSPAGTTRYDNQRIFHQTPEDQAPSLFLKQVVVQDASDSPNVIEANVLKAVLRLSNHITEELYVSDGVEKFYYNDLCFKVAGVDNRQECFVASPFQHPQLLETEPFKKVSKLLAKQRGMLPLTGSTSSPNSSILSSLKPGALFKDAMLSDEEEQLFESAPMTILSFVLDVSTPERAMLAEKWADKIAHVRLDLLSTINLVHSNSPNAYAASVGQLMELVERPRNHLLDALAKKVDEISTFIKSEDQFEVLLVLSSYIMMYATFMYLFMTMNKLGSRFTLGFIVLLNGAMAFLVSLAITRMIGIQLSLRTLSEALPLLVIVIGFEKPCQLTKAVLLAAGNEGTETPVPALDERIRRGHVSRVAKGKVLNGFSSAGPVVIRQVLLEMGVLMIGACSGVAGLWEFCTLAVLIVAFDCLFMFTFYMSALALKLEILRVRSELSSTPSQQNLARELARDIKMMTFRALSDSMVSEPVSTQISMIKQRRKYLAEIDRSIVARLRLIVLMGFFAFHLFSMWASPSVSPSFQKFSATRIEKVDTYVDSVERVVASLFPALTEGRTAVDVGVPSFIIALRHGTPLNDETPGLTLLKSALNLCVYLTLIVSGVINMYFILIQRLVSEEDAKSVRADSDNGDKGVEIMANHCQADVNFTTQHLGNGHRQAMVPVMKRTEQTLMELKLTNTSIEATNGLSRSQSSLTLASMKSEPRVTPVQEEAPKSIKSVPDLTKMPGTEWTKLSDDELVNLVRSGKLPGHSLEKALRKDYERAIAIRRRVVAHDLMRPIESSALFRLLPLSGYDYSRVHGQCCENVIGHMQLPVGLAGPVIVDAKKYYIPLATTEGCLVASTSRGCKAISQSGGAVTKLYNDGMTRGPCLEFDDVDEAFSFCHWAESEDGYDQIKSWFDSTSRFARLRSLKLASTGKMVFLRFRAVTGDAMGMNMISKGVEKVLSELRGTVFPTMRIISISGNYCIDKKASALNWLEGRGKSVIASCTVAGKVVEKTLKTNVASLVEVNTKKNLVGSAMAGAVGGFNAHAANIVTAMYIALGQDVAQNVESSMCMTWLEAVNDGQDLFISCSMPAIECGTVGGGTGLGPQESMLELLEVKGANTTCPGENAQNLARLVCATVLAGELSLLSALAAGHLVKSHMAHNRATPKSTPAT